ncbi:hypothetical protein SAMN05216343_105140 [Oscillibacter sp. PC13]|nr:hypothetical protein SAMN05216343_105140 [Oscillibacter sp. PC13]
MMFAGAFSKKKQKCVSPFSLGLRISATQQRYFTPVFSKMSSRKSFMEGQLFKIQNFFHSQAIDQKRHQWAQHI